MMPRSRVRRASPTCRSLRAIRARSGRRNEFSLQPRPRSARSSGCRSCKVSSASRFRGLNQEQLEAERDALLAALSGAKSLYTRQQVELGRQLAELEAQIIAPYDRSDRRAETMLRIHPLAGRAKQLREQLKQIGQILETRSRRWEKHEISKSRVERLNATFVSDQGHVFNMVLETVDQTPPGTAKPKTYYVADATTPSGRDEMGSGDDRVAAILAGLKPMLEEGDGYGRGEFVVMIDGQTHHLRIEAGSTKLLMEALENTATIASIAPIVAAPFTGGASLWLLIPIGIIGAIPAAYRLSQRVEDETFRWDLAAVMDLVSVVGAAVSLGQVAAGTRLIRLGRALMVTGFGTDGLSMVLLQVGIMEQIDATKGLPEGERKAQIAEIVGGALFQLGITAAGSLASRRYQQQAEAGPMSIAEPPVSRASTRRRHPRAQLNGRRQPGTNAESTPGRRSLAAAAQRPQLARASVRDPGDGRRADIATLKPRAHTAGGTAVTQHDPARHQVALRSLLGLQPDPRRG